MDNKEKALRLKEMLQQITKGDVESLIREPSFSGLEGLEGLESLNASKDRLLDESLRSVQKVARNEDLASSELFGLEAIILPRERPVVFVMGDSYGPIPTPWTHFDQQAIRKNIEAAIPSVGRIELPDNPMLPFGGTGFVVGDNLLMTNRHVGELFATGLGTRNLGFRPGQSAAVDFKREYQSTASINLRVREVVMIHPFWDMTLLKVEGLPTRHAKLRLSIRTPEELDGREIVVIGYPAQDARNDFQLQNQIFGGVFNVKRLHPGRIRPRETINSFGHPVNAMTHDSSTLGGNSGSAVFDVMTGEIVGLHFAGIYLKANYCVPTYELARDSRVVAAGVNFTGVVGATDDWAAAWRQADPEAPALQPRGALPAALPAESEAKPPAPIATGPVTSSITAPAGAAETTVTIPLHISIRLGATQVGAAQLCNAQLGLAPLATLEKIEINTDYSDREGYNPNFLGGGKRRVPLPQMTAEMLRSAVPNSEPTAGALPCELTYHHYSVVLNSERRLAYFTAVNIDGTLEQKLDKREKDKWIFDHRAPEEFQIGNDWYGRPFDRGHLVRRLDPAWGRSKTIAKTANDDTFHFTNCSPQHSQFNQGKNLWQGLENYLLDTANSEDRRISVFTGPIFAADDPNHAGVQIPKQYWKVVAWVRSDGSMGAAGFIVSQEELLTAMGLESTAEQVARTFQARITQIKKLTKLDFGSLQAADTFRGGTSPLEGVERESAELESFEQIQL